MTDMTLVDLRAVRETMAATLTALPPLSAAKRQLAAQLHEVDAEIRRLAELESATTVTEAARLIAEEVEPEEAP